LTIYTGLKKKGGLKKL